MSHIILRRVLFYVVLRVYTLISSQALYPSST